MGLRGEAPIYNNNAKQKTSNMPKPRNGIVNPFSDKFWDTWEFYKIYRKETHNFEFKGVVSEQMALKKVYEVSGGDDERAIRIVEQTIASGKWSGFYPLKTTTYKDGQQSKSSSQKGNTGSDSLEARVTNEFDKRFGDWKQNSNGDHLKAV